MKPTLARIFALLSLLLLVNGAAAADILKADNNTTLNLAGSWVGGVLPGTSDFATWSNEVSAANCSVAFGAVETIGGIKIINPGANVTIPFGNNSKPTLNGVNGVGIDASAATVNLDIEVGLYMGGNQTWTVAAGHSVNHATSTGNLFLNGHTVTCAGAGAFTIHSMQSGGAAGIVMNGPGSLTMAGVTAYALNMSVTLNGGKLNLNGQVGAASGSTVTLIINGGTNDNTSAGALTLNNNPPVTINGDFTFAGTQGLNWGTGAVTLGTAAGTTRTITASANTLELDGAIANGTTATNLTKAGAGTLTLSGANTYSGATTVTAGTLNTTTASTGAGSYAVSDSATLGVSIASASQTLNMSSLTLGSTAGPSTLNLTLGDNNPTSTVIADAGALTLNGTVIVNVLGGASLTASDIVLLSYGSGGTGTFFAGTLPNVPGYASSLTNDTSAKQLKLTFVSPPPVQWTANISRNTNDYVGQPPIPLTVTISDGINNTSAVVVKVVNSNPSVLRLRGEVGSVLTLTFAAGATNVQTILADYVTNGTDTFFVSGTNATGNSLTVNSTLNTNSLAHTLYAEFAPGLAIDGTGNAWSNLVSSTLYMDTSVNNGTYDAPGIPGNLGVNIRYAWDYTNLYILVTEDTKYYTAITEAEASDASAYQAQPWEFDTIAFWIDLSDTGGKTINGVTIYKSNDDFQPWFGFSSDAVTNMFYARANNGSSLDLAGLTNARSFTSGTFVAHNRKIEAAIAWADIAADVATDVQPGGDIASAVKPGLKIGSQPLLIYNNYVAQTFIGAGNVYSNPSGADKNSMNIQLIVGDTAPVSVTATVQSGQLVISWPSSDLGFNLLTSPVIGPGANWTAVGTAPTVVGSYFQVTLPNSAVKNFYRLTSSQQQLFFTIGGNL